MTTNNFKKAIENEVKNYKYASAIIKLMRIEEACSDGEKLGSTLVAVIAIEEDESAVHRWRLYYNYSTMKNRIGSLNYETYSEALDEFAKFAR